MAPYQLPGGSEVRLSCSIGIAVFPEHGPTSRLIGNADAAMFAVKRTGGCGIYVQSIPYTAITGNLVDGTNGEGGYGSLKTENGGLWEGSKAIVVRVGGSAELVRLNVESRGDLGLMQERTGEILALLDQFT